MIDDSNEDIIMRLTRQLLSNQVMLQMNMWAFTAHRGTVYLATGEHNVWSILLSNRATTITLVPFSSRTCMRADPLYKLAASRKSHDGSEDRPAQSPMLASRVINIMQIIEDFH